MVVYVEYVLLDNFIIDVMLISLSRKGLKLQSKKRGVVLAALIGAGTATLMPLLRLSLFWGFTIKAPIGLLIIMCSGKFRNVRECFNCYFLFLALTFAFGGFVTAVFWGLGLSFDPVNYSHGGEIPLFLILIIVYLIYRLCEKVIRAVYKRKNVINFTVKCSFCIGGKSFVKIAFLDSGNNLVYKKTDSPIVVCSNRLACELKQNGLLDYAYVDLIKIKTVSGECFLPIYKVENFLIYNCDKPNIINNVMLATSSNENLTTKDFDLIIGPCVYEVV